jgi:hypothetical protein
MNLDESNRVPLTYKFRLQKAAEAPFLSNEKRFQDYDKDKKPGPGAYNQNINGMDAKTWKVLNSENLRDCVAVTLNHRKLINAGFIRNNKVSFLHI